MTLNNCWLSIDCETSDQNKYTCTIDRVCIVRFNPVTGCIYSKHDFCFRSDWEKQKTDLQQFLQTKEPVVFHNAGFDLYLLEVRLGIEIKGRVYDTFFMAKHWRNDLASYSLKNLAWLCLGDIYEPLLELRKWIYEHNLKGEDDIDFNMTLPPDELVHNYCIHDATVTALLTHLFMPMLEDNYAFQMDVDMIRPNMKTEANQITVDKAGLKKFMKNGKRRIVRNKRSAREQLNTSGSPTGDALRTHLANLGERRKTAQQNKIRTDTAVLRDWSTDKTVRTVSRIRKDEKLINTYSSNILKACGNTNGFYPSLIQSDTVTRRYKSRGMYSTTGMIIKGQVQNIPRGPGIRSYITVPPTHWLVKMDLASIEARIGAHAMSVFLNEDWFSEQYRLDNSFNIYLHVVKECTNHGLITKKEDIYTAYKHAVLGIQYGVGVNTFHTTLVEKFELPYTLKECEHIYKSVRRKFPIFAKLQRAVSSIIENQGYVVDDFGAVYYLPPTVKYKGVNYYCQGCAGNVFKWWVLELYKNLKYKDYAWCFVHDEIDMAISKTGNVKGRVDKYCGLLKKLNLFSLPIVAEASPLCTTWAEAG